MRTLPSSIAGDAFSPIVSVRVERPRPRLVRTSGPRLPACEMRTSAPAVRNEMPLLSLRLVGGGSSSEDDEAAAPPHVVRSLLSSSSETRSSTDEPSAKPVSRAPSEPTGMMAAEPCAAKGEGSPGEGWRRGAEGVGESMRARARARV